MWCKILELVGAAPFLLPRGRVRDGVLKRRVEYVTDPVEHHNN
jgi:hypothetical protein